MDGRFQGGGDDQPQNGGAERGAGQYAPHHRPHVRDLEDGVPDQRVDAHLVARHEGEPGRLGRDVASPSQAEQAFPLENAAVAVDLVRCHGEPQEYGDDHAHEEIAGKVDVFPEYILDSPGSVEEDSGQRRQKGRLEKVDEKIAPVRDAGLGRADEEHRELAEGRRSPQMPCPGLSFPALRRRASSRARLNRRFPRLQVARMPVRRRNLPYLRRIAGLVDLLLLDDVEKLLGMHGSALRTGILAGSGPVALRAEMDQGVQRIPVEDGPPARVQHPEPVEHPVDGAGRLMDGGDNDAALGRLGLEQADHVLRVGRGKP